MMRRLAAFGLTATLLAGCATTTATTAAADPRDPFEPVNRAVFQFNEVADRTVIRPVAETYTKVVPEMVRTGVTSFFGNLNDVWTGANNFLQGKFFDGVNDYARVLFNTTFGFGGIMDWASQMGLEKHNEDFGQTLGRWGVPAGPYVVLPIFGPSSVRDTGGFVADVYAYPLFWGLRIAEPAHRVAWRNSAAGLAFVNARANALTVTDLLEQAALDRYSYVRSAYFQRRLNQIWDGQPPPADSSSFDAFRRLLAQDEEPDAGAATFAEAAATVAAVRSAEPDTTPATNETLATTRATEAVVSAETTDIVVAAPTAETITTTATTEMDAAAETAEMDVPATETIATVKAADAEAIAKIDEPPEAPGIAHAIVLEDAHVSAVPQ